MLSFLVFLLSVSFSFCSFFNYSFSWQNDTFVFFNSSNFAETNISSFAENCVAFDSQRKHIWLESISDSRLKNLQTNQWFPLTLPCLSLSYEASLDLLILINYDFPFIGIRYINFSSSMVVFNLQISAPISFVETSLRWQPEAQQLLFLDEHGSFCIWEFGRNFTCQANSSFFLLDLDVQANQTYGLILDNVDFKNQSLWNSSFSVLLMGNYSTYSNCMFSPDIREFCLVTDGSENELVNSSFITASYSSFSSSPPSSTSTTLLASATSSTFTNGSAFGFLNIENVYVYSPFDSISVPYYSDVTLHNASLILNISGFSDMIYDGVTLTLFQFSQLNGTFSSITVVGESTSCLEITGEPNYNSNSLSVTMNVVDLCTIASGAILWSMELFFH